LLFLCWQNSAHHWKLTDKESRVLYLLNSRRNVFRSQKSKWTFEQKKLIVLLLGTVLKLLKAVVTQRQFARDSSRLLWQYNVSYRRFFCKTLWWRSRIGVASYRVLREVPPSEELPRVQFLFYIISNTMDGWRMDGSVFVTIAADRRKKNLYTYIYNISSYV